MPVRLAALLLVTVALGAAPAIAESPVTSDPAATQDSAQPLQDVAFTADLRAGGYRNGRLPSRILVAVTERCLIEEEAAAAWQRMAEAAAADGIELTATWCYRSLEAQVRTYARNCGPDPATALEAGSDASHQAQREECRVPTAQPGRSNHGWGRAVDLTVDGEIMACYHLPFAWLEQNAPRFGWVHPKWAECGSPMEEAWHWEWGGLAELPDEPAPDPVPVRRFLLF